jgi:hypothetical protein
MTGTPCIVCQPQCGWAARRLGPDTPIGQIISLPAPALWRMLIRDAG